MTKLIKVYIINIIKKFDLQLKYRVSQKGAAGT